VTTLHRHCTYGLCGCLRSGLYASYYMSQLLKEHCTCITKSQGMRLFDESQPATDIPHPTPPVSPLYPYNKPNLSPHYQCPDDACTPEQSTVHVTPIMCHHATPVHRLYCSQSQTRPMQYFYTQFGFNSKHKSVGNGESELIPDTRQPARSWH